MGALFPLGFTNKKTGSGRYEVVRKKEKNKVTDYFKLIRKEVDVIKVCVCVCVCVCLCVCVCV